jgi:sugar fermentation stimulation protein A
MDVLIFSPARKIDPEYAAALDKAVRKGVEVLVAQATVTPEKIDFRKMLPVEL